MSNRADMNNQRRSERSPSVAYRLYRGISPALVRIAHLVGPLSPKLSAVISGRVDLMKRLTAAAPRVSGGIWFHVTSVGEYEQSRPLIAALKSRPNSLPVVVTHFSPSGYDFSLKNPCGDYHDYLPFDHPADMEQLVSLWRPKLLVFVKFDCWPNQVVAASDQGVPVILLAGSLQPKSTRLRPGARTLYRDVFNRFTHLGVCTEEDKTRFEDRMNVSCPVTVTGDTRVEQVILRYESAHDGETASRLRKLGGQLLILGSTWPPDEKLWLPILPELLTRHEGLRVVLTPHEPLENRLLAIESELDRQKVFHLRLSQLATLSTDTISEARVILTDSIGVLAEIYRAGHLAYVGGSFTTGVHNTMEPAIAGMPVLFGPVIQNAEEAGMLVRKGAGLILRRSDEALDQTSRLLQDEKRLQHLGSVARRIVLNQRGATQRSMAVIDRILADGVSSDSQHTGQTVSVNAKTPNKGQVDAP